MLDAIKNKLPLNWSLLSNPINWIIVFLMISIAGLAIAAIIPSTSTEEN